MKIVPQSVKLIDHMGSDISVVNAARVSFHKESQWELQTSYEGNFDEGQVKVVKNLSVADAKLIGYLAKHNHFTPFTHAMLSFRMKAPIFIARQLLRSQVGLTINECSRRYVDDEPEFFMPESWRKRAENVKQGSSDETVTHIGSTHDYFGELEPSINEIVAQTCQEALNRYNFLLKGGIAPEQARMVLPQNMMTEWIWSGSLAAFARVYKLRIDPHAQKEVQEIAKLIADQVPPEMKVSWAALTGQVQ